MHCLHAIIVIGLYQQSNFISNMDYNIYKSETLKSDQTTNINTGIVSELIYRIPFMYILIFLGLDFIDALLMILYLIVLEIIVTKTVEYDNYFTIK